MENLNLKASLISSAISQSQEREANLRLQLSRLNEEYLREVRKLRALKLVGQALGDIDKDPARAFDVFTKASEMPRGKVQREILRAFDQMNRPLSLSELSHILGRNSTSLSQALGVLCKRGHLTRVRRGLYVR